jgi:hypothetical protein
MKLLTKTGPALALALTAALAAGPLDAASARVDGHSRGSTASVAERRAARVVVHPGQSIQRALERTRTGGTVVVRPGTYRESLTISRSVHLRGRGALLRPPAAPPVNVCTLDPDAAAERVMPGMCVAGRLADPTQEESPVVQPLSGVSITGFRVRGFTGAGVEAYGVRHLTLSHLRAEQNPGGGVFVARADHVLIRGVQAVRNGAQGLNLHSRVRHFSLAHNVVTGNHGEGIFVGDSRAGVVERNSVRANCVGILVLDLGLHDGGVTGLRVVRNHVVANNRFCAGDDEGQPSESGTGVALVGARHTVVAHNTVRGNVPSRAAFASFGGVALLDAGPLAGGAAPSHDRVVDNVVLGNQPRDVVYDRSGGHNRLAHNRCRTTTAPGACG